MEQLGGEKQRALWTDGVGGVGGCCQETGRFPAGAVQSQLVEGDSGIRCSQTSQSSSIPPTCLFWEDGQPGMGPDRAGRGSQVD